MTPTIPQEAGGSGSRARRRRRRQHSPVRQSPPSSSQRDKKRGRAGKQAQHSPRSTSRKRPRAAGKSREDEQDAPAESASSDAERASSSSSAVSSPRRCPSMPQLVAPNNSTRIVCAYIEEQEKYFAKLDRERKLLTLDQSIPRSCLASRALLPVRESATKIVNQVAKVVVGLSSYVDDKLLAQCSGFLTKLDTKRKVATILTSADLLCTKFPSIHDKSSTREFAPLAKVDVHLLDDSIVEGHLLNYHKHYNIAVFEVAVKEFSQVPNLCSEVKLAQEVFVLGRDASMNLIVNHGRVDYMGPGLFENNHYMYITCGVTKCGTGGPVVDFDGRFVGMACPTRRMSFIPFSVILRCLRMWEKFKRAPRLQLGLKFSAIKYLDPSHSEKISRKFKIDDGLIVKMVSEGSPAEETGIRIGDIIECCNGKQIPTTVDLENELLQICEDHLDEGNDIAPTLDVTVGVFNIRKESHHTKRLAVKLSDDVEIISGGTYDVSPKDGFPILSTPSDDTSQGEDVLHGTSEIELGENLRQACIEHV